MKKEGSDVLILLFVIIGVVVLSFVGNVISGEGVRLAPIVGSDESGGTDGGGTPGEELRSVVLEGKYGSSIVDHFDEDRVEYLDYVNVNGKLLFVEFNTKPKNLGQGDLIRITGKYSAESLVEKRFIVENTEIVRSRYFPRGGENPVLGEQKTAVIVVNWDDVPELEMYTKEDIYDVILNNENPDSTANWFLEVSYGKTWLSGDMADIYGIYDRSYYDEYASFLDFIIGVINFDEKDYRRILFIRAEGETVGGRAVTGFGLEEIQTNQGLREISISRLDIPNINFLGELRARKVLRHELGHNFGARHSSSYDCENQVLGEYCPFSTYGDYYDVMGRGDDFHFNAAQKEILGWKDIDVNLGWFDSGNVKEILVASDFREYTLESFETPTLGLQALKIPSYQYLFDGEIDDAETLFYFVEFRDKIGFDSYIAEPTVIIHLKAIDFSTEPFIQGSGNSLLLMGEQNMWTELLSGEEFYDEFSNIAIKVIEIGDGFARISVNQIFECLDFDEAEIGEGRGVPSEESILRGKKIGKSYSLVSEEWAHDYCDPKDGKFIYESYCNPNYINEYYRYKCPGQSRCIDIELSEMGDYCNCDPDGISQITYEDEDISKLGGANSIYIQNDYAYVTSYWENSMSVIDISDPYNPDGISQINNEDLDISFMYGFGDIYVQENYAYVASAGGFVVIDISDPYNPDGISQINNEDPDVSEMNSLGGVYIQGNFAYVVGDSGLSIINLLPVFSCFEPFCGNGILDPGEECDDGNGINPDECNNNCKILCVDSDNGNNIYDKGYVEIQGTQYWDYCMEGQLYEYVCDLSHRPPRPLNFDCTTVSSYPCIDGACIKTSIGGSSGDGEKFGVVRPRAISSGLI